jgi:large subunit ribosomal protein L1
MRGHPGHDARGRPPGPRAGPKGPHAHPKVRNGDKRSGPGRHRYQVRQGGVPHRQNQASPCSAGHGVFRGRKARENFRTLMDAIVRAKPASAKGTYIRRRVVCPRPWVRASRSTRSGSDASHKPRTGRMKKGI